MKRIVSLILSIVLCALIFTEAVAVVNEPCLRYAYGGTATSKKYGSSCVDLGECTMDEVYEGSDDYYTIVRNALNDNDKIIYDYIVNYETKGVSKYKIDVSSLNLSYDDYNKLNFNNILCAINYDHPDYFWISSITWGCSYYDYDTSKSFSAGDKVAAITINVPYDETVYPDVEDLYSQMLDVMLSVDFAECENRYEFLKTLHDYLCRKVEYDNYEQNPRCFDIIGSLIDGKSVCMGYSFAIKLFCNYYKIPCVIAVSDYHMWNVVQMEDGIWYNLDVTWDDQNNIAYDYFLCGTASVDTHFEKQLFTETHEFLESSICARVPISTTDYVLKDNIPKTDFPTVIGHIMVLSSAEIPATCIKEGKTASYKCVNGCGYTTGGKVISKLEHNYKITSAEIPATCNSEGRTAVYTCQNGCGNTKGGEMIPQLKHNLIMKTEETPATCNTDGKTAVYVCSHNCGYTIGGETIPKLGHNMQITSGEVKATCTTAGKTAVYTCANGCGKTTGGTVIPALGHDMVLTSAEVPATCTTNGKTAIYTCKNGCNHTEGGKTIKKTGHNFSKDWTVDVEATCTTEGSKSHHCLNCGAKTDVTVIKATGHTYSNTVCTKCGAWENADKTVTLGKITVKNGSITFTWNKLAGATGYVVYRKTNSGSWTKLATTKSLTYTDKSMASGNKYSYSVCGQCGGTNSKYNTTGLSAYYLASPTLKIANGNGYVKLSWGSVSGAKGFYIYRKLSTDKKWTKIYTADSPNYVALVDKTVKAGKKYIYSVQTYNGKNVSIFNSTGATTVYLTVPKLSSVSSAKSGVTLKWGKVTGASGYIVYRKTGSGKFTKLATVKGNTNVSYLDKSAKKGTTYYYTVKAYNSTYYSAYNSTGLKIKDKY